MGSNVATAVSVETVIGRSSSSILSPVVRGVPWVGEPMKRLPPRLDRDVSRKQGVGRAVSGLKAEVIHRQAPRWSFYAMDTRVSASELTPRRSGRYPHCDVTCATRPPSVPDDSPANGFWVVATRIFSVLTVATWSSHRPVGSPRSRGVAGRFICLAEIGLTRDQDHFCE